MMSFFAHDEESRRPSTRDRGCRKYLPKSTLSPTFTSDGRDLAVVVLLAGTDGKDFALVGLLGRGVGNHDFPMRSYALLRDA